MAKQAEANQTARRKEFEAEPFSDTKGIALVNSKLENDDVEHVVQFLRQDCTSFFTG